MAEILMTFERGGELSATLLEDRAPETCKAILEALPVEAELIHAMWAGEEVFFSDFPGEFAYESPTNDVAPGDLAMVARSNSFCIFYGRSIPRGAVDREIDVTVFARVDDIERMSEIGRRVRTKGTEKVTITRA